MDFSKLQYFFLFFFFILIAQSLSILGQFVTLPYKNLTMWQSYTMALPFAWLDWIFLPIAVHIGDKYELVSPNHILFLIILIQFGLTLLVNRFYMKKQTSLSDIAGFTLILLGFFVSYLNLLSEFMGWSISNKEEDKTNEKNKNMIAAEQIE